MELLRCLNHCFVEPVEERAGDTSIAGPRHVIHPTLILSFTISMVVRENVVMIAAHNHKFQSGSKKTTRIFSVSCRGTFAVLFRSIPLLGSRDSSR